MYKDDPKEIRVVFMGTPEFAVPPLKTLMEAGFDILAVVTQPDRPRGRGRRLMPSPVKEVALSAGLTVLQPEKASDPGFIKEIQGLGPDFLVVAAYGQILKKALLNTPRLMPVNVHASYLPRLRGAAPIQRAILSGDATTGITIMQMDEGMDTGPILLAEEIRIGDEETFGSLHDRLSNLGARLLIEALTGVLKGNIHPVPQPETGITYAPPIKKEELEIKWNAPSIQIHRKIRAFDPTPGAYTYIEGNRVRLFTPMIIRDMSEPPSNIRPGTLLKVEKGEIVVATGDGAIAIGEIQWPGKKRMSVDAFLRGHSLPEGLLFGSKKE